MGNLTALDLAMLAYPFRRADHEFLEGYVYIQEEAITERLDAVDPNWSIAIDEAIAYGDSIVCLSTLTVKGVNRSNAGGNPVQRDKKDKTTGKYEPQPLYTQADNGVNAHKAAATDALKRCARMFGIGRYLLSAPKEGGVFDGWLADEHKAAKAKLDALRTVDTATGEISVKNAVEAPPAPQQPENAPERATASQNGIPNGSPASMPNGPPNGGVSTDKLAAAFPAASKWTAGELYASMHDYFNAPAHFEFHMDKHAAEYTGLTLEEAAAFVRQAHWNFDKDQCDKLAAFGKNTLALTNNEILAALSEANGHSVKGWKTWDGGDFTVAQGALLAWQSGYEAKTIYAHGLDLNVAQGIVDAALVITQVYQQAHADKAVTA